MYIVDVVFFFNDTATTEIYTLSLHDALPISCPTNWKTHPTTKSPRAQRQSRKKSGRLTTIIGMPIECVSLFRGCRDRKSTRLNSSHANISYAVFCLKKKNNQQTNFNTVKTTN